MSALESIPSLATLVDACLVTGAFPYAHPRARTVHNPSWEEGRQSSLACGAQALLDGGGDLDAVLVLAIDQPLTPRTLTALLSVWRASEPSPQIPLAPSHDGRNGHPLLVPAVHLTELAALGSAPDGLRAYRRARGFTAVPVPFPEVLRDLNDLAAWEAAVASGIFGDRPA